MVHVSYLLFVEWIFATEYHNRYSSYCIVTQNGFFDNIRKQIAANARNFAHLLLNFESIPRISADFDRFMRKNRILF
jgi:hypothetical protein